VPNRLILGEIAYQTILHGFNASLFKEDKNKICVPYNFSQRYYHLKDPKLDRQESSAMLYYRFFQGNFRRHDPLGLVAKTYEVIFLSWPYTHEKW
jgi:hypothetical protein